MRFHSWKNNLLYFLEIDIDVELYAVLILFDTCSNSEIFYEINMTLIFNFNLLQITLWYVSYNINEWSEFLML